MKSYLFLLAFVTLMGSAMLQTSTNPADGTIFGPAFGIAANASTNLMHWFESAAKDGEEAANSYWQNFQKLPSFTQRKILENLSDTDFQKAVGQAEHIVKNIQHSRGSVERSVENAGDRYDNVDHSGQKSEPSLVARAIRVAEFLKSLNRIGDTKIVVDIQKDPQ